jgi:hypothetical protein
LVGGANRVATSISGAITQDTYCRALGVSKAKGRLTYLQSNGATPVFSVTAP